MEITRHLTRHGVLCHYAADQTIGAALRIYGEWAEEELFLLSTFTRRNDWVLDVGANVGTHALAFSRFVGPGGRIIPACPSVCRIQLVAAGHCLWGSSGPRSTRNLKCLTRVLITRKPDSSRSWLILNSLGRLPQ
jgi:hypothetical protein